MLEWLKNHPEVAWGAFTLLLSIAFRVLVHFAPNHPRVAAIVKLAVALGWDANKASKAIRQLVTGKYDPLAGRSTPPGAGSAPPSPPSIPKPPKLPTFVLFMALALAGCATFSRAARPATFGAGLAACNEKAPEGPAGWAVYTPCCRDVARAFSRDESQCERPDAGADGGAR